MGRDRSDKDETRESQERKTERGKCRGEKDKKR